MTVAPRISALEANRIFFALAALLFGALFYSAVDTWFDIRSNEAEELQILTSTTSSAIESYFDNIETNFSYLGEGLLKADVFSSPEKAQESIDIFKNLHKELSNIHLFSPSGKMLASSEFPFGIGADDPKNSESLKDCANSTKFCILPISQNHDWATLMVYPVMDHGYVRFWITTELPLKNQQFLWQNLPLPEDMSIVLIRENGMVQSHYPAPLQSFYEKPHKGSLLEEITAHPGRKAGLYSGYSEATDQKIFGAFQRLDHYPMTVSMRVSASTLWQHWGQAMKMPFIAALFLIALGFISYRYLRQNARRFESDRKAAMDVLRSSEEQHRAILRTAMDGFLVVNSHGHILDVNDAYCLMSGFDREELLKKTIFDLKFKKSFSGLKTLKKNILEKGADKFETIQESREGNLLNLDVSVNFLAMEEGLFFAFIRDITDRKNTESALHAEKELAHVTLESIGDAVITTDSTGLINYMNPVAENLTGWKNEAAQGLALPHVFRVIDEKTRETLSNPVEIALKEERVVGVSNHAVLIGRSGSELPIEDSAAPIRNREKQIIGVVLIFRDVSGKRELLQRITWQAGHDALTHLPNRALLQDRLVQAMAGVKRKNNQLAVLFLDLDGFKEINDQFGHACGDALLKEIACRLLSVVRNGDTVSRLGGDEFVMLLEVADKSEVEICLSRIMDEIRKPLSLEGYSAMLSSSIGVTIYPLNDADADTLLRHADMAMYQAKQSGRNQYRFFDIKMDLLARENFEIQERLAAALAREEFRLFYQPKVNLRTGLVTGVEALIRWQHPEKGLLSPVEFLPFAEENDLIIKIGDWVIEEALSQMDRWEGLGISVSVNIAARQLQSQEFLSTLEAALQRHPNISPEMLELEILETTALEGIHSIHNKLKQCKQIGVKLSLDDFGTGYSSLAYLKNLPADTLKIDQSFVRDMIEDKEDMAIIEGVVSMAKIFNRSVIAEGMESAAHGLMLLRVGCESAQGYGIAKPMPPEAIPGWIESWAPDKNWAKWSDTKWDLQDFPLLVAQQDTFDEVKAVFDFTEGDIRDPASCRFLAWSETFGECRYGHLAELAEAVLSHKNFHEIREDILRLKAAGKSEMAQELLPALFDLRDDFCEKLLALESAVFILQASEV